MPPVQCPECGRFLKTSFVASLADEPAPCPGCETELRPDMVDAPPEVLATADTTRGSATHTGSGSADTSADTSVRPPDLAPEEVRGQTDVLSGWDSGVGQQLDAWATDRPPFPTDAVVVGAAGLAGLVVGAAVWRDRRGTAAAAGAVVGIVGAAAARRIWRLDV